MKRLFFGTASLAAVTVLRSLICAAALIVGIASLGCQKGTTEREADSKHPQHISDQSREDSPNGISIATVEQLRTALLESAARLVDLKIRVVERGNFSEPSADQPVPVVCKEMCIHAASAQVRMDWRANGNGDDWWMGFEPTEVPITTDHLTSTPGVKQCVDMGRELAFADSRLLTPGPGGEIRTLHTVSKTPQFISNLFVPLVELNAPWIPPSHQGGSLVVNEIARRPLSAWRLLGDDKLGTEDVLRVEVCMRDPINIPLKRRSGELSLTPVYFVWVSKKHGFLPVRIEQSMRYGLEGRDYWLERRPDGQASLVYEASDFIPVNGTWVARVGRQCTYRAKEQSTKGFSPDDLADTILAEGTVPVRDEMQLGYSFEWRILDIEQIDPSLNLWFEPQAGAEVVNSETHKRFVQGDTVASAKFEAREQAIEALIGQPAPEFPKQAKWLNGQPMTWETLRGKVVILDFWAEWCGPCRNDLPQLSKLHDDRQANGLITIGVHLAGSEFTSIQKAIEDHHLEYPICIDIPNRHEKGESEEEISSEYASQFGIHAIPHFVVVDRRGIVAASLTNRFQDALDIAEKLASEPESP